MSYIKFLLFLKRKFLVCYKYHSFSILRNPLAVSLTVVPTCHYRKLIQNDIHISNRFSLNKDKRPPWLELRNKWRICFHEKEKYKNIVVISTVLILLLHAPCLGNIICQVYWSYSTESSQVLVYTYVIVQDTVQFMEINLVDLLFYEICQTIWSCYCLIYTACYRDRWRSSLKQWKVTRDASCRRYETGHLQKVWKNWRNAKNGDKQVRRW